eukprot:1506673-Pyramimonas_sp.AAC.2
MAQSAVPLSHPPIPRHRSPPVGRRWAFSSPSVVGGRGRLPKYHPTLVGGSISMPLGQPAEDS